MKLDPFFDESPLLLAVLDHTGSFETLNSTWLHRLGMDAQRLEQSLFLDVVHPEDRARLAAALQASGDYQGALRLLRHDGGALWVSLQVRWHEDEQAYYLSAQDETKHRESQADLESTRLYLEGIVQTVREPLVVLENDLRIRMVNSAFYTMFQATEAETVGRPFDDLGQGQWQIPKLHTLLDEIVTENTSFEDFEVEHEFPGIGLKTMLLNARQIEIDGRGTRLILLAIEDITARKQVEIALAENIRDLARSNAELEQFAYVASHDLQEPLRMVASYVQLLARRYRGKLDADADDFIGFAVDGASRMQVLINDLLAYSRVDRKGRPFEPVDCERVMSYVLTDLEASIAQTQTTITSDALPVVNGDRGTAHAGVREFVEQWHQVSWRRPTSHSHFCAARRCRVAFFGA